MGLDLNRTYPTNPRRPACTSADTQLLEHSRNSSQIRTSLLFDRVFVAGSHELGLHRTLLLGLGPVAFDLGHDPALLRDADTANRLQESRYQSPLPSGARGGEQSLVDAFHLVTGDAGQGQEDGAGRVRQGRVGDVDGRDEGDEVLLHVDELGVVKGCDGCLEDVARDVLSYCRRHLGLPCEVWDDAFQNAENDGAGAHVGCLDDVRAEDDQGLENGDGGEHVIAHQCGG